MYFPPNQTLVDYFKISHLCPSEVFWFLLLFSPDQSECRIQIDYEEPEDGRRLGVERVCKDVNETIINIIRKKSILTHTTVSVGCACVSTNAR